MSNIFHSLKKVNKFHFFTTKKDKVRTHPYFVYRLKRWDKLQRLFFF